MRYLGGKSRIAPLIGSAMMRYLGGKSTKRIIEPFIGGGGVTPILCGIAEQVSAFDTHPDLCFMWQGLLDGSFTPPDHVTLEEYKAAKLQEPSALRGFIGFGCSFGGKWFGGYARTAKGDESKSYALMSKRSLAKSLQWMVNVTVAQADYRALEIQPGDVVYADPPYVGTTTFGVVFDTKEFWEKALRWDTEGAIVFVSEQTAPSAWAPLWEKPVIRSLRGKAVGSTTEKLFVRGPLCPPV